MSRDIVASVVTSLLPGEPKNCASIIGRKKILFSSVELKESLRSMQSAV
jgi:hypothetical protein